MCVCFTELHYKEITSAFCISREISLVHHSKHCEFIHCFWCNIGSSDHISAVNCNTVSHCLARRFNRIDLILPSVPINVASSIRYGKTVLSEHIPAGDAYSQWNSDFQYFLSLQRFMCLIRLGHLRRLRVYGQQTVVLSVASSADW